MLPIFLAAFEKARRVLSKIGVRNELCSRKQGLPPFAKNAKDGAPSDTLLGDQFQDVAAAVIDYVHFSGVVLAER